MRGIADAHRDHRPFFPHGRQRAVVIAAAITEPAALPVEGQQRHQQQVRFQALGRVVRMKRAEGAGFQRIFGPPAAKFQRVVAILHGGQGQIGALGGQLAEQRHHIGFVADRDIAGNGAGLAPGQMEQEIIGDQKARTGPRFIMRLAPNRPGFRTQICLGV